MSTTKKPVHAEKPPRLCLVCGKHPRRSSRTATCSPKCQKRWRKFMSTEFARYMS